MSGTVWMVMMALVTGGDDWAFPFPPIRFLAVVDEWDLRCRRFIRVADIITANGNQHEHEQPIVAFPAPILKPLWLHYYARTDLWNGQQREIKVWRFVPETLADFKGPWDQNTDTLCRLTTPVR